jgi:hypothetical protein
MTGTDSSLTKNTGMAECGDWQLASGNYDKHYHIAMESIEV